MKLGGYHGPFTVYTADYQPVARKNAIDIPCWNSCGQPQDNVQTLSGFCQTKYRKLFNPLYNVFYNFQNNNFGEPNPNNPYTAVLGLQQLLKNLGLGLVNQQAYNNVLGQYMTWNNKTQCAGYNNSIYPRQMNMFMNPQMFAKNNNVNMNMNQWNNMLNK